MTCMVIVPVVVEDLIAKRVGNNLGAELVDGISRLNETDDLNWQTARLVNDSKEMMMTMKTTAMNTRL